MKNSINFSLLFLLLLSTLRCRPAQTNDSVLDADMMLMEYLKKDLPISSYLVENKASIGIVDTLPDFDARMIRPEIPELFSGFPCLIIQDLKTGKCYSACRPNIYFSDFGGNLLPAQNPLHGVVEVPDTVYYPRDHCSNLIALESFLNEKYRVTDIAKDFLKTFFNTYFGNGVSASNFEELKEMVEIRLKDRQKNIKSYSWELASTLAKIKEVEKVSDVYAHYLYKDYGSFGISIRVYRISFCPFEERAKKEDTGPFQYRIAIDEI